MTLGLDTSVAVRLLVGEPAKQAEAARRVLDEEARDAVIISYLVVGETYFVLCYHYAVPHAKAVAVLRRFRGRLAFRARSMHSQELRTVGE